VNISQLKLRSKKLDDDDAAAADNDDKLAFASVTHSWVEKSVELVGVNGKILRFCKLSMENWNTGLHLKTKKSNAVVTHSDMKRNIPGRLSFTITLFCSAFSSNKRAEQS
jgi:hypothetical protein